MSTNKIDLEVKPIIFFFKVLYVIPGVFGVSFFLVQSSVSSPVFPWILPLAMFDVYCACMP